jgi:two-component system NarL family response regulator
MTKESPIRILIAEDHPIVRDGLAVILDLQPDMTVVAEAENGQAAVELARKHRPDVALIDLRMPVMNGVEAIALISKEFPDCRILVLTTYDGDQEIAHALQAGAHAYLLKDMSREELLAAIRAVHAGERRIPPSVARRLAEHFANPGLTRRELEVLRLLTKGKSNREIAAALFITEATVKGHLNNVFDKLGVQDRTRAVTTALRRGIVSLEESE